MSTIQEIKDTVATLNGQADEIHQRLLGYAAAVDVLRTQLADKNQHLAELSTILYRDTSKRQDLEATVKAQDQRIAEMGAVLDQDTTLLNDLRAELKAKDARIAELLAQTCDDNDTILALRKAVETKETQVEWYSVQLRNDSQTIAGLEAQIKAKDETIADLAPGRVGLQEQTIANLKEQLALAEGRLAERYEVFRKKCQEALSLRAQVRDLESVKDHLETQVNTLQTSLGLSNNVIAAMVKDCRLDDPGNVHRILRKIAEAYDCTSYTLDLHRQGANQVFSGRA